MNYAQYIARTILVLATLVNYRKFVNVAVRPLVEFAEKVANTVSAALQVVGLRLPQYVCCDCNRCMQMAGYYYPPLHSLPDAAASQPVLIA
jgi:hypothetical protein